MNKILAFLLLSTLLTSCNQQSKPKAENKKIALSYFLPTPFKWTTETFPIPITFAPSIAYKGSEEVRFAPGWGNVSSNEYWTYAFLWNVEGKPTIDSQIIKTNLTAYYSGLINSNIEKRQIPRSLIFTPDISIEKIATEYQDDATYTGTIHMLDYMTQNPITFNCIIHVRLCDDKDNTFIFHEISPKPLTDTTWKTMNSIWTGFKCEGN